MSLARFCFSHMYRLARALKGKIKQDPTIEMCSGHYVLVLVTESWSWSLCLILLTVSDPDHCV